MSAKCKICSESGGLTHRISNQHHRRPSIGSWYWFISRQQIMLDCAVRGTNPLHHSPPSPQPTTAWCKTPPPPPPRPHLVVSQGLGRSQSTDGWPSISLFFSLFFAFSATYRQSFSPYLPVCGLTRLGCVGFSFQLQLESCRFVDVADLSSMEVWQYQ